MRQARKGVLSMPCSKAQRKRQRDNRRLKRREEALGARNAFGALDPTPQEAVRAIRNEGERDD
jgi:hypothetical protein